MPMITRYEWNASDDDDGDRIELATDVYRSEIWLEAECIWQAESEA